ncbi:MAG: hypothetical protein NDI88_08410 [Lysobacter sp.]|nr:hypothetical protein [Lysobacter sp.]
MANETSVTVVDRLAVAGVSFVAALVTAAVIVLVGLMGGGDLSIILASGLWAVAVAGVAAVVGFVVGPVRASKWWGFLWGTEDPEKHRGFTVAVVLAIIVTCLWSLLR